MEIYNSLKPTISKSISDGDFSEHCFWSKIPISLKQFDCSPLIQVFPIQQTRTFVLILFGRHKLLTVYLCNKMSSEYVLNYNKNIRLNYSWLTWSPTSLSTSAFDYTYSKEVLRKFTIPKNYNFNIFLTVICLNTTLGQRYRFLQSSLIDVSFSINSIFQFSK